MDDRLYFNEAVSQWARKNEEYQIDVFVAKPSHCAFLVGLSHFLNSI